MAINIPIIWVLGGPGSGKGTQCARIVKKYCFTHLSSGDLLRAEVASGSSKGKELDVIMKEGKLVPNEEVLSLLSKAIRSKLDHSKGFLIDGYPREKDQSAAFEREISLVDLLIYFECPDDVLVSRIMARAATASEQRTDDNEETIKTRLLTFHTNTAAILSQYAMKTAKINANRPEQEIFCDVICAIDCMLCRRQHR